MKKIIISILIISVLDLWARNNSYITFGPMAHFNFGNGKYNFSSGFEISYWNLNIVDLQGAPGVESMNGFGFDFGLDFEKEKFRIYFEPQIGWGVGGISIGPVFEKSKNVEGSNFGIQGSGWLCFLLGIDLRLRLLNQENNKTFSPGIFGKIPIPIILEK